ncbi:MAG: hypothetical protein MZW92_72120 [Comamonadaceae bacterium]|nr:hypothetical protein [Comamonadaceae bacterium]
MARGCAERGARVRGDMRAGVGCCSVANPRPTSSSAPSTTPIARPASEPLNDRIDVDRGVRRCDAATTTSARDVN